MKSCYESPSDNSPNHPHFPDFLHLTLQEKTTILQQQHDILSLVAQGQDAASICRQICLFGELLVSNSAASIMLLDKSRQVLKVFAAPSVPDEAINQLNDLRPGPGTGSCGNAVYRQQPVFVENTLTDPRWREIRHLAEAFNIYASWSVPIRAKDGKTLGAFSLSSFEHRLPNAFHQKLLELTSNLVSIVLDQQRTNEQLFLAGKVFENSMDGILITDPSSRIISVNPAFSDITGYSAEEVIGKNPNLLSSGRQDKDFYRTMWHAIHTVGSWRGEIWNRHKNGDHFPIWLSINGIYDKKGSITHYLGICSDISEIKRLDQIIWKQANFDYVTGLPNRNMFQDRLEQDLKKARQKGDKVALFFIDLDHFKEINDSWGHGMGDILLKEAAQRIGSCVRDTDTVARLGGDEFTVILSNFTNDRIVGRIAQNILEKLSMPFYLEHEIAYISASIGITLFPCDADSIETLLKNADHAMYAAKNEGRNRYHFFTPAMQAAAELRRGIANDLRAAIAGNQLQLYYQPIIDLESGTIHKAEALLRWLHPEKGLISPEVFVPIAEETRMIVEIGDWVFRQAAQQAAIWKEAYHRDFQISVNKSPVQFLVENRSNQSWLEYLSKHRLDGRSIVVEITESLLLDANERVESRLLGFREAGIKVAIDDFGTGYSSLSYLKKFDISYLKIDKSFVHNITSQSNDLVLCEAIISMAHRLGIKVIAEGVETQAQCDLLAAAGCDYGQGYFFSRPLSKSAFEALLLDEGVDPATRVVAENDSA
jgi:diguanylate cyclase (GGDEF)-like protein/PAS domain S-box-containing protein